MRIGLISDTHIPDHAKELPPQLKQVFRGVDLILHAGDIYLTSVLDELECLAPVLAAEGDDDPSATVKDSRVKKKHVLSINGVTLWLMHEQPWPYMLANEAPDVVVFGDSHETMVEKKGGILLVNPGSPTFPYYKFRLGTVALLSINAGKPEVNIVQLQ